MIINIWNNIQFFYNLSISALLSLILFTNTFASNEYTAWSKCNGNLKLQRIRSQELQNLMAADQADRKDDWRNKTPEELLLLDKKDLARRVRVGEIFAEGCFKDSQDYMAAALIYQHGDSPDHFYQAFVWSKRASELGDRNAQHFSALAIDRYLINIGMKQLFGSQYRTSPGNLCYCMEPVEPTVSDDFRKAYLGQSLSESYQLMVALDNGIHNCKPIDCDTILQPTPKGTIIGLW